MPGRVAWKLSDPVTFDEYFLPVNPLTDNGSHGVQKVTKYAEALSTYVDSNTILRINDTVIQDSPDELPVASYAGTIYTKDQLDKFKEWFSKDYPIQYRDDLGREYLVLVVKFSKERVRSAKFRFKHSYSLDMLVLEEL